jgi:hypothetical protein
VNDIGKCKPPPNPGVVGGVGCHEGGDIKKQKEEMNQLEKEGRGMRKI